MMRFFVRNLFAKLFLLGLLALPVALYALNESKQLAEAGITDDKRAPAPSGGEAELKQAQNESARLAAMPSDLRKELLFPGGRLTNDAGVPFLELGNAVRNRAAILAAHRHFLLQFNAATAADVALKFEPLFAAGLGKDLTARYAKLWADRRDQLVIKTRLADLRAKLAKADAKTLPELATEINLVIDDYTRRWSEDNDIVGLREELTRRQLAFARDAVEAECIRLEAAWKRFLQIPSPDTIKSNQAQIDELLKRLKALASELQSRDDPARLKWTGDMLAIWIRRRDFLPEALTLLESVDKSLAEARIDGFFAGCRKLVETYPTEETRNLVRGVAEDFCTRYLVKQPMDPVKYDGVVSLLGHDRVRRDWPRRQIKIYLKNDERRFLENGDPLKNDGFTEFHAEKMKDSIKYVTVFDADLKDPLPGGSFTQVEFTNLKPTPKSAAVRFYCEEYRKVDRWNAAAVREFVKKCEAHKDHLGEIYNRLSAMDKAMDGARAIFTANPK